MQTADKSPIDPMATLSRISHSGMFCNGASAPSTGELGNSLIRADQLSGLYPY
jgi:hypothetical protein